MSRPSGASLRNPSDACHKPIVNNVTASIAVARQTVFVNNARSIPPAKTENNPMRQHARHGTLFGQPISEPFLHLPGRYPFPARLNEHVLSRFRESNNTKLFRKGSVLFEEGASPNGVFIIVEGRVKTSLTSSDGRTLMVGFFGPGSVLGIAANVLRRPYEATAEATTATKAIFISRQELIAEIQRYGIAAWQIAQLVSENYFFVMGKLGAVQLSESVPQSIARLLLGIIAHNSVHDGDSVQLGLSQEAIAQMVGVSRETVSRTISKLQKEGVLDWKRSDFVILNRRALERLAESSERAA